MGMLQRGLARTGSGFLLSTLALLWPGSTRADYDPGTGHFAAGGTMPSPSQINDALDYRGRYDLHSVLAETQRPDSLVAGTVDATPAINAALSKGAAFLPCGTYRLDSAPLALGSTGRFLRGAGRGCVTLNVTFATGDVISLGQMGAAGLGPEGLSTGGFRLVAAVPRSSGAGVAVGTGYGSEVSDIAFEGPWADEIRVQGNGGTASRTFIHNFRLGTVAGTTGGACLRVVGYANDVRVQDGGMNRCGTGVVITNGSGIQLGNVDVFGSVSQGVLVNPSAANRENVNALYTNGPVFADTSGSNGWELAGDAPITDVHLSEAWGSGSGTAIQPDGATIITSAASGLVTSNPAVNGLSITSGHFHHNGGVGVLLGAGKNITIDPATQVFNNGVTSQNGPACAKAEHDGIRIGPAADWVTVIGARSGTGGYMAQAAGLPNCQRYGLYAGSGTDSLRHLTIIGVQAPGNQVGGTQMPAGPGIVGLANTQ